MNEAKMNKLSIAENINFYSIIDNRFKTNRISINIITNLEKDVVTLRAILPLIMKRGFKGCDNFTKLNEKLEELYGAYIEADVQKRGDLQVLTFAITALDDKLSLGGDKITKEICQLLCNMVLFPNIYDDNFITNVIELEKTSLIDMIEGEINDKRSFAINSLVKKMCDNEGFGIPKYGFADKVNKITPDKIKFEYENLISSSDIEIIFTGCGNEDVAVDVLRDNFLSVERKNITDVISRCHPLSQKVNEYKENFDVTQSKMVLGFANGVSPKDDTIAAIRLMVSILGGSPSSKLFLNVRERLSLCYYCAARYDIQKGIMIIDCGVEKQNIDKAKNEIIKQLESIKKGDVTQKELDEGKLSLKNAFGSVYESDYSIESFYLGQILIGSNSTPQKEKEKIDRLTKEDVINAASMMILDTVYILTDKEDA